MTLKSVIETRLHEAIKSKNDIEKSALRTTLASIKLMEVEKGIELDDTAIISIIQKEIKIRKEAMSDAEHHERKDLAEIASEELSVLTQFLPEQISEQALRTIIAQVASDLGATSLADTGRVMKAVIIRVNGQAGNDIISKIVKDTLTDRI